MIMLMTLIVYCVASYVWYYYKFLREPSGLLIGFNEFVRCLSLAAPLILPLWYLQEARIFLSKIVWNRK
jgi:hypothetical protein